MSGHRYLQNTDFHRNHMHIALLNARICEIPMNDWKDCAIMAERLLIDKKLTINTDAHLQRLEPKHREDGKSRVYRCGEVGQTDEYSVEVAVVVVVIVRSQGDEGTAGHAE